MHREIDTQVCAFVLYTEKLSISSCSIALVSFDDIAASTHPQKHKYIEVEILFVFCTENIMDYIMCCVYSKHLTEGNTFLMGNNAETLKCR